MVLQRLIFGYSPLQEADDTVSEWLRRWTRNPLGSARRGSNPLGVAFVLSYSKKSENAENRMSNDSSGVRTHALSDQRLKLAP